MPKGPVIAIDFDDIVFDFHTFFHAWHNREYGTNVEYERIHSFVLQDVFGEDADTLLTRVRRFTKEVHPEVTAVPGALEGLRELRVHAQLHLVTSRSETNADAVTAWLKQRCPYMFSKHHFTNGYGGLPEHTKRKKSEVCKEIGAVVLIEDAISHAGEVAGSGIPVIMPNRPWNRAWEHPEGIHRANSWDEIVRIARTHI